MNNSEKVSIRNYLKHYKEEEDLEILFKDIATELKKHHDNNYIVGDLTTDNIYIGQDGNLSFDKIKANQNNIQEEKNKDIFKYFLLMVSAYLGQTEKQEIKNKLKDNSNIAIDDVAELYANNSELLPSFEKLCNISGFDFNNNKSIKTTNNHLQFENNNLPNSNGNSSGKGKARVLSNGKSVLKSDDSNKYNGFITMFVFPFLIIYSFLMLAILYWMIVLK